MAEKTTTLLDLKKYFEERSSSKFASEWKELSPEDKAWFKAEVTKMKD